MEIIILAIEGMEEKMDMESTITTMEEYIEAILCKIQSQEKEP